jgi:hypothetical protein
MDGDDALFLIKRSAFLPVRPLPVIHHATGKGVVPEEGLARLSLRPARATAFAAGMKADACLWTKRARYPASALHK